MPGELLVGVVIACCVPATSAMLAGVVIVGAGLTVIVACTVGDCP